ncbi:MAG: hypothetical protein JJ892_02965 [Balneola sp.]|nr:hypothetical protein [Balneola sp.]MBO6650165.1 hypothetical protein [Balneola sp.]MBO6710529.1 hypothetical protein [Balneola sp.]MBO6799214.1 hypothetical protein [Balneola sp.]MBO6871053.1 hypothetical protein [Balneola sp.]
MSFKFYSLVLFTLAWAVIVSCDDALTPKDFDEEQPYVQNLVVSPSDINFDPQLDGQKDTTLTFNITVDGFNFGVDSVPYYSIFVGNEDLPSLQRKFPVNFSPITTFQTSISIETNTINFENYTIIVSPTLSGSNTNYAQSIVKQTGVAINAPEILEVVNPDTIQRPAEGQTLVFFEAKVRDSDGQSNLDRVLIRIIDHEVGEAQGSPFEMFDDGSSNNDRVANDSLYTYSLPVTQTNNRPNRDFDIEYFAIDKSGLVSDTVRTTFSIRE